MTVPFHLQPIVEAMVAELERQSEINPQFLGLVDADHVRVAVIDGQVDLVALASAVAWCPMGDNHHNAALCPYCSPKETS